ncbi:FHA protein [Geosmithia morbida]|uniref:FHA protein n=1 Tax=Geosmithia morbida TaxID=1094350 RepID=A0A9P4YPU2_9HYPO|nr:FHA protein [Geosmithia morbida]KAF4120357.1 FHA protein [Geosmithia morbida]
MTRPRASTTGDAFTSAAAAAAAASSTSPQFLPSIRLSAYYDPRSTRPSLTFPTVSRTLPTGTETIRVGRYSERDNQPAMSASVGLGNHHQPSAAAVGFKSKVVSRRHCEFWYENGKWYIRDVKSSSGTFLNHIRLSPPSQESKAFPVNDGDIVQLGIDFKGGEEMIFRCVKMRIELNRGWQNKLNTFNSASTSSQDCSICLNSIGCVRSLLNSPQYPIFICPNCRAGADLEADVDDTAEEWERLEAEGENGDRSSVNGAPLSSSSDPASASVAAAAVSSAGDGGGNRNDAPLPPLPVDPDAIDATHDDVNSSSENLSDSSNNVNGAGNLTHSSTEPLPITGSGRASTPPRNDSGAASPSRGPMTPRNEAGPWVFDGRDREDASMSLDAAADVTVTADAPR